MRPFCLAARWAGSLRNGDPLQKEKGSPFAGHPLEIIEQAPPFCLLGGNLPPSRWGKRGGDLPPPGRGKIPSRFMTELWAGVLPTHPAEERESRFTTPIAGGKGESTKLTPFQGRDETSHPCPYSTKRSAGEQDRKGVTKRYPHGLTKRDTVPSGRQLLIFKIRLFLPAEGYAIAA